jgi:hypothetical protein
LLRSQPATLLDPSGLLGKLHQFPEKCVELLYEVVELDLDHYGAAVFCLSPRQRFAALTRGEDFEIRPEVLACLGGVPHSFLQREDSEEQWNEKQR